MFVEFVQYSEKMQIRHDIVQHGLQVCSHVLYDADEGDVAAGHGVVLVRAEDVRPRHDNGQVVVVGQAARRGGHLHTAGQWGSF